MISSRSFLISLFFPLIALACCKEKSNTNSQTQAGAVTSLTHTSNGARQFIVANDDSRIERRFAGLEAISSYGTIYYLDVFHAGKLPRGSALMTSSGNLAAQGITQIIHAASGSSESTSEHFIPTLEGVSLSINNSLRLASNHGVNRVAIPFIGRGIFLRRIGASPRQLADSIIRSALENRANIEVRFVIVGATGHGSDFELFQNTLQTILNEPAFQNVQPHEAQVINGDIINFSTHGASAIINAANMEVRFGGGISGAIATAIGINNSIRIDSEAQELIRHFNERVYQLLTE